MAPAILRGFSHAVQKGEIADKEELLKLSALFIAIAIFVCPGVSRAGGPLRYELKPEAIRAIEIHDQGGRFFVTVILNEKDVEDFYRFTRMNTGNRIEVVCSGTVISAATVNAPISSGIIQASGKWERKEDAQAFITEFYGREAIPVRARDTGPAKRKMDDALENAMKSLAAYETDRNPATLQKGMDAIDKAMETAPGNYLLSYWKATLLANSGDFKDAIFVLNSYMQLHPSNEHGILFLLRGMLLEKIGKTDKAGDDYHECIRLYREIRTQNPEDWDALMHLSQALVLNHQKESALKLLEETVSAYPKEAIPRQLLDRVKQGGFENPFF